MRKWPGDPHGHFSWCTICHFIVRFDKTLWIYFERFEEKKNDIKVISRATGWGDNDVTRRVCNGPHTHIQSVEILISFMVLRIFKALSKGGFPHRFLYWLPKNVRHRMIWYNCDKKKYVYVIHVCKKNSKSKYAFSISLVFYLPLPNYKAISKPREPSKILHYTELHAHAYRLIRLRVIRFMQCN